MKKSSSYDPEENNQSKQRRSSTTSSQRKRNSSSTTSSSSATISSCTTSSTTASSPQQQQQQQRHPVGLLPVDFNPGPMDVICAVGSDAKSHEGNIRFRNFVDHISIQYGQTTSKLEKTRIVDSVIGYVRNYGGGFIKYCQKEKRWSDVGGIIAREKVGQCLRANNHTQYKSSTKTKRRLRKQINDRLGDKVATIMSNNATVASEIQRLQNTISSQLQHSHSQQQQQPTLSPYSSYSSSSIMTTTPGPPQLPIRSASAPVVPSLAPSPPPATALDDSALELAMTNANIRILASLKSDLTFQTSLRNMTLNNEQPSNKSNNNCDDEDQSKKGDDNNYDDDDMKEE